MTHLQPGQEMQKSEHKREVSGGLIAALDPTDVASEAYRRLRTNLLYAIVDAPPKVIMVTSPGSAEGKSTVCANLGVVLAQAGKRVLIMDCDLRRPTMHEIFGLSTNAGGLVDAVMGDLSLQEAQQEPLEDLDLKVLTVGDLPPNPAEFVNSRRFSEFLAAIQTEFDYVLVDSSPTGLVADPLVLATQVDGVLLTLDARKTRRGDVRRAMRGLTTVGAQVLGTVMNNVIGSRNGYYQGNSYLA
jgi:capsular exopolysaccharide synthesis family protein